MRPATLLSAGGAFSRKLWPPRSSLPLLGTGKYNSVILDLECKVLPAVQPYAIRLPARGKAKGRGYARERVGGVEARNRCSPRVLVWAPPDEPRRMPEAPAVQSAEVELTDEGGRKRNPRIKALVLPPAPARHQPAAEAPTPLEGG